MRLFSPFAKVEHGCFRRALDMLYCAALEGKLKVQRRLVRILRRSGLAGMAAAFLDAGGPILPLGAQAAYLINPIMGGPSGKWNDFGKILEDPDAISELIVMLRKKEDNQ